MAELVEIYIDLPLVIVDAAVIAIAERLPLTEIATLDQRHLAVMRLSHTRASSSCPALRGDTLGDSWMSPFLSRARPGFAADMARYAPHVADIGHSG